MKEVTALLEEGHSDQFIMPQVGEGYDFLEFKDDVGHGTKGPDSQLWLFDFMTNCWRSYCVNWVPYRDDLGLCPSCIEELKGE